MKGIDVSTIQGLIDWQAVRADGVEFAMIKASQGRSIVSDAYLFKDRRFSDNVRNAAAAGISVGVWHYLTAATVEEAKREADYFISVISPYRQYISLWAAVDVEEDRYLPGDETLLTDIVTAFCDRAASAGFKPCVYTNPNYLKSRLNDISSIPLWLALWRNASLTPSGYSNMVIWQYGKSKAVNGIKAECDVDFGFFELPAAEITAKKSIVSGDRVKILPGAVYTNGKSVPERLIGKCYTVTSVNAAGAYFNVLYSRIKPEGLDKV